MELEGASAVAIAVPIAIVRERERRGSVSGRFGDGALSSLLDFSGWSWLGAIEYQLGDYTASCYYLESALAKKADLMSSREMLGMAYHLNKKPLRAVATLATAVANQPESPRAHNQLAVVLQAMAWYDGAEKSLLKAIQLDPDYRDAHFNLALIYIDRKAPSSKLARQHYETAVELGASPDKELEERLKRSP